MTIAEAIEHCIEKSKSTNCKCAKEHLQLAEWLIELQELRGEKSDTLIKSYVTDRRINEKIASLKTQIEFLESLKFDHRNMGE